MDFPHPLSPALRASRALDRVGRRLRSRESETGLNPAQWEALRYLATANRFSRSPGAVSAWIATTRGTASQTLMALERKGLITRAPDSHDRRSFRLDITDAGRARLADDPQRLAHEAIAGLQPLHLVALGQALARVLEAVKDGRNDQAFAPCAGCRHHTRASDDGDSRCGRYDEAMTADEAAQLCAAHEPAPAP
jgi:DNA-binding MarR family transcriptional regulator